MFADDGTGENTGFQFYALDKRTRTPVDMMHVTITGNVWSAPEAEYSPRMVAWGGGDNKSLSIYTSPAELAAAKGNNWKNALTTAKDGPSPAILQSLSENAEPLSAQLARVLGLPAGSRQIGPTR